MSGEYTVVFTPTSTGDGNIEFKSMTYKNNKGVNKVIQFDKNENVDQQYLQLVPTFFSPLYGGQLGGKKKVKNTRKKIKKKRKGKNKSTRKNT